MKENLTKIDKFLDKALDQMFKCVGFERFDKNFTEQNHWYSKKTWSNDTHREFRVWFINTARKDLKWNKTYAEKEFLWFDLMWGWRREDYK
jgi:hypothetical protein